MIFEERKSLFFKFSKYGSLFTFPARAEIELENSARKKTETRRSVGSRIQSPEIGFSKSGSPTDMYFDVSWVLKPLFEKQPDFTLAGSGALYSCHTSSGWGTRLALPRLSTSQHSYQLKASIEKVEETHKSLEAILAQA